MERLSHLQTLDFPSKKGTNINCVSWDLWSKLPSLALKDEHSVTEKRTAAYANFAVWFGVKVSYVTERYCT